MIRIGGTLQSGVGHFRPRMRKFEALFREATGEDLYAGTLNVRMDRAFLKRYIGNRTSGFLSRRRADNH